MNLKDSLRLYHGSYITIQHPDLEKCAEGKDFGKGFYVTTDFKQAERFVKSAVGKAIKNGVELDGIKKGYVSEYDYSNLSEIKIYEFSEADKEWLHCVAAHRRRGTLAAELEKWKKYDIIAGKIANDNTNQVITAYINGAYGEVGTERADEIAINLLMPQKLTDQICFRSSAALKTLSYIGTVECEIK